MDSVLGRSVPPENPKDVVVFLGRKRVTRMSVFVPEISPLFISSAGMRPLGDNIPTIIIIINLINLVHGLFL